MSNSGRVVILSYHQITADEPVDVHAVSAANLSAQMSWLRENGYQTVYLEDIHLARRNRLALPEKPVVITFDDGYLDSYTNALPILSAAGFQATVFLVADEVGGANRWDQEPGVFGAPLLGWSHAREMARYGIRFGSHTCTHPRLAQIGLDEARAEIEKSRRIIEDNLGEEVKGFAYPYGGLSAPIKRLVQQVGYSVACRCESGYVGGAGSDILALQRTLVLATDTLPPFAGKVRAGLSRRLRWYAGLARRAFQSRLVRTKGGHSSGG